MTSIEKLELALSKGYTVNDGKINGVRVNDVGSKKKDGYLKFNIRDKKNTYHILNHRFIFYYYNGYCPESIDHINRDKYDNRIENLRPSNDIINAQNRDCNGYTKCKGRYRSRIKFGKTRLHLGYFDTKEEAREAYIKAKVKYHNCFYKKPLK